MSGEQDGPRSIDAAMRLDAALHTLAQRRNWLSARIEAKRSVGYDLEWDVQERDALALLIAEYWPEEDL
jgi:hypothetical protein